jgi:hypothetical protein
MQGFDLGALYNAILVRPLLLAAQYVSQRLEARGVDRALVRIVRALRKTGPPDHATDTDVELTVLFFLLGTGVTVAYLLLH